MIKINIFYNNKDRENVYRGSISYIKKNITFLNKKFKKYQNRIIYFNLMLSGDNQIRKLNKMFRNKNKTTDVLSFPNNDKFLNTDYLGDVAINFEIVDKRSKDTNFNYEFDRMWVHGYLHLLGFDHKKIKDFAKMSKIEKKILDCFDHTF